MTTTGNAAVERLEAHLASLRASYLDVVRDSLIGRLNEDPPLPASKVDRYYDNVREQGLDWPSTAPSMIGARRMENVRSECERVIKAGVPGDFMETGVWRGGACIMMRAVLRAYQIPDRRVLAAYGRALAAAGNYKGALAVLDGAHAPGAPDWRVLSVQGAALDQMGRHAEAQRYYATALRIAPDEPSVLANLGLSYALAKDLVRAEATLRRAAVQSHDDPQVRQKLALVMGLQQGGRPGEAPAPVPPSEANVVHLRQALAQ